MVKLKVGIFLFAILSATFSATPQFPDPEFRSLLARASENHRTGDGYSSEQRSDFEIDNVCFYNYNDEDQTFYFKYKGPTKEFTGKTFIPDKYNPNKHHFALKSCKSNHSLKLEFETEFSDYQLRSGEKGEEFCTTAQVSRTARIPWDILIVLMG